jgi:activator of 2-hydroxyglutaryl-CoA dehydratase
LIKAGIEVGAKTIKVVLMGDGEIKSKAKVLSGFDQEESAKEALEQALMEAGLSREAIGTIVTTGNGRKAISYAKADITEARAAASAKRICGEKKDRRRWNKKVAITKS